jgi:NAD-dependent DNA ligase
MEHNANSYGDRRSPSELVVRRLPGTGAILPIAIKRKYTRKRSPINLQKILDDDTNINERSSQHSPEATEKVNLPISNKQIVIKVKRKYTRKNHINKSQESNIVISDPVQEGIMTEKSEEATENIRMLQRLGITTLNKLNQQELRSMIDTANNAFHSIGESIMTDAEYDILHEYIKNKYPKSEALKEVGAPILKNKATLPYEMASMDKIKPDTGSLPNWMTKYKGSYVISAKLDGVSGLYTTEDSEPKLYTRGDGKVGQDISYMIPYLKLPKKTTEPLVIRGEFIIKKEIFDTKYKQKYANSRNLVAGIVNSKSLDDKVRDVDFVAYEVIKPANLSPSQQMKKIASQEVITVQNLTISPETLTNEYLSDLLQDWRINHSYEIDGIIVSNDRVYPRSTGNPDHSFAFKMVLSDQIAETHVIDVEWTASKDGYLKPIIHVQPVNVGGVTIKKATGFNADFIEKNKIGVGAIVQIIRSGDVIPYIKSVTTPATSPKMPLIPYIWNTTHIDIMLENAQEDMGVRTKQITGFFQALGVDGIGEGNVKKIVQAGFDRICKITVMTESDFIKVDGFQEKSAKKFVSGIHEKIETASLPLLMSASNIFGRGFGQRKTELIMKNYPNVLDSQERDPMKVAKIDGMAKKTAEEFVSHIPAFIEFLRECHLEHKLTRLEPVNPINETMDTSHTLYEKSVITTGFRSKELEERLKKVGAKIGSSVNKSTFAVIVKDKESTSGKSQEARTLGIPVFTEDEFVAKYLQ